MVPAGVLRLFQICIFLLWPRKIFKVADTGQIHSRQERRCFDPDSHRQQHSNWGTGMRPRSDTESILRHIGTRNMRMCCHNRTLHRSCIWCLGSWSYSLQYIYHLLMVQCLGTPFLGVFSLDFVEDWSEMCPPPLRSWPRKSEVGWKDSGWQSCWKEGFWGMADVAASGALIFVREKR